MYAIRSYYGRVDEHELRLVGGVDAHHPVARGLRLPWGDADFLPDDAVEQRRLADVGAADDGDEATLES